MLGIYLGAGKAFHPNYNLIYQDIDNSRDLGGSMLDIDLSIYDFIIATPPCNYWSRARGNRCSQYSLDTKDLLPHIIDKLVSLDKPFLVENVKNDKRMYLEGILPRTDCLWFYVGRHIYFTNCLFDFHSIIQRQDFKYGGNVILYDDMSCKYHQGGFNVFNVVERFLESIDINKEVN